MRPLSIKQPHELIGSVNRLVGWVKISPLPAAVRGELLLYLGRCISLLAGVDGYQEAQIEEIGEDDEADKTPTADWKKKTL